MSERLPHGGAGEGRLLGSSSGVKFWLKALTSVKN
jgi:hypothetical protein